MNSFGEMQQASPQRAKDPHKIVRQWGASQWLYENGDSKGKRTLNPDFHQPICQRQDGKFCDVEGRLLPLSKVPAYIQEEGKTRLQPTAEQVGGELSLADAMRGAAVLADRAEAEDAPKPRRRRAKKTKE
jgi:hypothetical protein